MFTLRATGSSISPTNKSCSISRPVVLCCERPSPPALLFFFYCPQHRKLNSTSGIRKAPAPRTQKTCKVGENDGGAPRYRSTSLAPQCVRSVMLSRCCSSSVAAILTPPGQCCCCCCQSPSARRRPQQGHRSCTAGTSRGSLRRTTRQCTVERASRRHRSSRRWVKQIVDSFCRRHGTESKRSRTRSCR